MTSIKCSRCSRKYRESEADRWNVTVKQGVVVGYLCPRCQTAEENVEAEINAATLEYGVDDKGRLTGRPKDTP